VSVRLSSTLRSLVLGLLSSATFVQADDLQLQIGLEKTYNEWRSALLDRNIKAWFTCTTAYRQASTRNLVVSQRQRYPDAVFALPIVPPDVRRLKLVECEAVGDTAHLVYFGRVDLGVGADQEIPDNLLVLKYFKEGKTWKFDSTKFYNLADNVELREACKAEKYEFLTRPPFNPPGIAPPVPKLCPEPDRVASLRIQAAGYEVRASVNGYTGTPVVDTEEQQLIIGGLTEGENALVLLVKELPIEPGDERYLEVEAVLQPKGENDPTVRVFDWVPKVLPVPGEVKLKIFLNNLTRRGI
jgi:hypothetical protein